MMRLTVRREQMEVMAAVAVAGFESRIAEHLRSDYPLAAVRLPDGFESAVQDLTEESLTKLIRIGIEKAKRYQLTRQSSIAVFVVTMFDVSPNFDEHRLCEVLLGDDEKSPDDRVDEIASVLAENNWALIRKEYDPNAWNLPEVDESPGAKDVVEEQEPDKPFKRTISGKTLAKVAKQKNERIEIRPEATGYDLDTNVNTVKIERPE